MHATSVNDDTLANRTARRDSPNHSYPRVLSRSAFFQSPASLCEGEAQCSPVVVRCSAVRRGAAETSKRAAASHAWLARVRVSPLSLPLPFLRPRALSLFFSVDSILRHLSLFHSLVPASRPRPNPCARVMIRDCVKEVRGQNLPSCVALSLARSLYLFRSFSCSSLFHSLFLPRVRASRMERPCLLPESQSSMSELLASDV